ncbi:DNA-binding domain-containing protein [Emcibacter nanhaiensis]|uniref:DUF2063 domain-containing protein n=1 Tax=Emcibacter nanhaiensis TaxID=1505037 RepID=A0A501PQ53_9PROT|nr:DNA-binding domain-containing protein [Emcibacter nanhaiensis]TPD62659.1 DUF2063 domain-containing protein [Emcibacter nanhaiensis]
MTSLADLQKMFKSAVMERAEELLPEIAEGGRITPEKRLAIYAYAYGARLRETLEKDYPVLHSLLGDDQFHDLCNGYIAAFPSQHPSLRFFGQRLAEYLQEGAFSGQPFLAEMARFEWTFIDAFDAPDISPVTVEEVGTLDPGAWTTLRFEFHPSLNLNYFDWNVPVLWSAINRMNEGGEPEAIHPEKNDTPTAVIQWRSEMVSYFRSLERDEAEVLARARRGADFPVLCGLLGSYHGDMAPMKAAEYLKIWIAEGLVCALEYAHVG